MKTFLLILGVALFGLGVRGVIVGLTHGSDGSFVVPNLFPGYFDIYANIVLVLLGLYILNLSKKPARRRN